VSLTLTAEAASPLGVAGMRQTSRSRSAFERTEPGSRASWGSRSSRPESGNSLPAQLARRAAGSSNRSPSDVHPLSPG